MKRPHEFITVQTVGKEEVRVDPETGEDYMEEIILAKDKKMKITFDLEDITSFQEYTNDDAIIYGKRCLVTTSGERIVLLISYNDLNELIDNKPKHTTGFGKSKDSSKKKKSS